MKIEKMTEKQVKEILIKLISKLNELDCEDYFGTEGWQKFLGIDL